MGWVEERPGLKPVLFWGRFSGLKAAAPSVKSNGKNRSRFPAGMERKQVQLQIPAEWKEKRKTNWQTKRRVGSSLCCCLFAVDGLVLLKPLTGYTLRYGYPVAASFLCFI